MTGRDFKNGKKKRSSIKEKKGREYEKKREGKK